MPLYGAGRGEVANVFAYLASQVDIDLGDFCEQVAAALAALG